MSHKPQPCPHCGETPMSDDEFKALKTVVEHLNEYKPFWFMAELPHLRTLLDRNRIENIAQRPRRT